MEDHNTGFSSTPFSSAYNVPPVPLLAPSLRQEWEDPIQLAGQVPFKPIYSNQNSKSYAHIECSESAQVPCDPLLVDESPTWTGAFDLSPHLDLPVNFVCLLFLAPGLIH
jgi:hypothetical protein